MEEKPSTTRKMSFKMPNPKKKPVRPPCPEQCNSKKCKDYKPPPPIDLSQHVFIWIYGGPASGKSMVCTRIIQKYGFVRLHCGELLSQEVTTGSVRAKLIQNDMDTGELVPSDVVLPLLRNAIESKVGETTGFVIDGYPRDVRQGQMFEKSIAPVDLIIYLDALKDVLTTRHLQRVTQELQRWDQDHAEYNCATGKLQLRRFFDNHKQILDKYLYKMSRINSEARPADILVECEAAVDKAVSKHKADLQEKLEEIQRIKDSEAVLRERRNRHKL